MDLFLTNGPTYLQRYVRTGSDINCGQRPLVQKAPETATATNRTFAYAWYISKEAYHCSALSAFKMLKKLRQAEGETSIKRSAEYQSKMLFNC